MSKSNIEYTEQHILNQSRDDKYGQQLVVEIVGESNDELKRIAVNSDGSLKSADPLDGYKVTDIDDSYFGYLKSDGSWYIMRESSGTYRYVKGDSDYSTAWTGRGELSYQYFNVIF